MSVAASAVAQPGKSDVERRCWCGSNSAQLIGTFANYNGGGWPLVRCDGCGVLALHPQPSDEELAAAYSDEYFGATRRKFIWPASAIVDWMHGARARMTARLAPPGARVLDIGCGNGGYLIQMKRRGFQVEGTEWTARSAARVPADAGIPIHVGDLLDLNLPRRSYDLITMWHVLEHLSTPDQALARIAEQLKPGGTLVLEVPNAESSQARRFGLAWLHHDPPRHLFGFDARSLKSLLESRGFKVQSIRAGGFDQNSFGFIQSWLNARGYPRDRLYAMLKGNGSPSAKARIVDCLWLGVLLGPGLAISAVEALRGSGATIAIEARVKSSS